MSERVCPVCGGEVVPEETGGPEHDGSRLTYVCTRDECDGRLEDVSDDAAASANEPTGGEGIGA